MEWPKSGRQLRPVEPNGRRLDIDPMAAPDDRCVKCHQHVVVVSAFKRFQPVSRPTAGIFIFQRAAHSCDHLIHHKPHISSWPTFLTAIFQSSHERPSSLLNLLRSDPKRVCILSITPSTANITAADGGQLLEPSNYHLGTSLPEQQQPATT